MDHGKNMARVDHETRAAITQGKTALLYAADIQNKTQE